MKKSIKATKKLATDLRYVGSQIRTPAASCMTPNIFHTRGRYHSSKNKAALRRLKICLWLSDVCCRH